MMMRLNRLIILNLAIFHILQNKSVLLFPIEYVPSIIVRCINKISSKYKNLA